MFWVNTILTIILGLLGLSLIRDWFRSLHPNAKNTYFDILIVIILLLSVLATSQIQISNLNKEELQRLAMITPIGEEAKDVSQSGGLAVIEDVDVFKRVFVIDNNNNLTFSDFNKCTDKKYISDINFLIKKYPKIPYPYVALAFCLKFNKAKG